MTTWALPVLVNSCERSRRQRHLWWMIVLAALQGIKENASHDGALEPFPDRRQLIVKGTWLWQPW
ncbi:MAG: hypothetical protein F4Z92_13310 [Gemmatimonadetes bacterium]|nr:hypothetical protein [Gemmatimonadota bacterium]